MRVFEAETCPPDLLASVMSYDRREGAFAPSKWEYENLRVSLQDSVRPIGFLMSLAARLVLTSLLLEWINRPPQGLGTP